MDAGHESGNLRNWRKQLSNTPTPQKPFLLFDTPENALFI
jgi:hypothetical protein